MLGLLMNFQTKITHLSVVFLRWQLGMTFTRSVFLIVQHTVCLLRTCTLEHRKHSSGLTITKLRQLVQSRSYLDKLQHTQVLFFPTHCSHIRYDLNFQQQSKPGFKILLLARLNTFISNHWAHTNWQWGQEHINSEQRMISVFTAFCWGPQKHLFSTPLKSQA